MSSLSVGNEPPKRLLPKTSTRSQKGNLPSGNPVLLLALRELPLVVHEIGHRVEKAPNRLAAAIGTLRGALKEGLDLVAGALRLDARAHHLLLALVLLDIGEHGGEEFTDALSVSIALC